MKTFKNADTPFKIAETIAIMKIRLPLSKPLMTGLGYAATPYWVSGDTLYILNCALNDATIICGLAQKEQFLWGKFSAPPGKYQLVHGKATLVALAADEVIPRDYMDHAPSILNRQELIAALDETRTFLSRGQHRRAAVGTGP